MQRISGVRLINFLQTWGEQSTPGAWNGHLAHPVLFAFAQKINKFWYVANGMRTIRGWRSTSLQSHPHICAFGLQTIRERFANHSARLCIRGFIVVNIPSQLVELIILIYNSLLQSGMLSVHAVYMCKYLIIVEKASPTTKENYRWEWSALLDEREYLPL